MKSTHKIIGIIILTIVSFNFALSQQQQNEEELIIGTWVEEEGNSIEYRWEFLENGTLQQFSENQIDETFYWQIDSGQTPSGLTISHLKLINMQDANDVFVFEINGLNQERLVLVCQRLGGGLGQLTTYLRQ